MRALKSGIFASFVGKTPDKDRNPSQSNKICNQRDSASTTDVSSRISMKEWSKLATHEYQNPKDDFLYFDFRITQHFKESG